MKLALACFGGFLMGLGIGLWFLRRALEDFDAARVPHYRISYANGPDECSCGETWPCRHSSELGAG